MVDVGSYVFDVVAAYDDSRRRGGFGRASLHSFPHRSQCSTVRPPSRPEAPTMRTLSD